MICEGQGGWPGDPDTPRSDQALQHASSVGIPMRWLHIRGCEEPQDFLFSLPVPVSRFEELLRAANGDAADSAHRDVGLTRRDR